MVSENGANIKGRLILNPSGTCTSWSFEAERLFVDIIVPLKLWLALQHQCCRKPIKIFISHGIVISRDLLPRRLIFNWIKALQKRSWYMCLGPLCTFLFSREGWRTEMLYFFVYFQHISLVVTCVYHYLVEGQFVIILLPLYLYRLSRYIQRKDECLSIFCTLAQ